jgi:plasmid stability protein
MFMIFSKSMLSFILREKARTLQPVAGDDEVPQAVLSVNLCYNGSKMEPFFWEFKMATITVKNIPDDLYEQLKQIAKANQRSINSEVIYAIRRAVSLKPLDVETVLERARQTRELTADYVLTDEEITRMKNEGRP